MADIHTLPNATAPPAGPPVKPSRKPRRKPPSKTFTAPDAFVTIACDGNRQLVGLLQIVQTAIINACPDDDALNSCISILERACHINDAIGTLLYDTASLNDIVAYRRRMFGEV